MDVFIVCGHLFLQTSFHVYVSISVVKFLRNRIVGSKVVADVIFIDLPNYLLHRDCITL